MSDALCRKAWTALRSVLQCLDSGRTLTPEEKRAVQKTIEELEKAGFGK